MEPILPFWFKQRQCQYEPAGADNQIKVTGPNLGEAYLRVWQAANGRWQAAFRRAADGPDDAISDADIPDQRQAWDAAFELYRQNVIV